MYVLLYYRNGKDVDEVCRLILKKCPILLFHNITITQVSAGLFNTTYGIPRATTIPADNTEHKVSVHSCWKVVLVTISLIM